MSDERQQWKWECQKCGAVGGAVLRWTENGVSRSAWCCPRCVSRCIDEREALLEALRHVDFVLKEENYRGGYVGPFIAQAIAKAEAP